MEDFSFGTVLGFLFSILLLILTSYIQWIRDERNRRWELEDRKLNRRLDSLAEKLAECRDYVNHEYDISAKLFDYQIRYIYSIGENNLVELSDDKTYNEVTSEEIAKMLSDTTKKAVSILNLDDNELSKLSGILQNIIAQEIDDVWEFMGKIENKIPVDQNFELNRIIKSHGVIANTRKLMMKRIDELSGFEN